MHENPPKVELDSETKRFVNATYKPPRLEELPPVEGRKIVSIVQDAPIEKPDVEEEWIVIDTGPTGPVRTRIVRPTDYPTPLPVILYLHGNGWVFGDAHTHDLLVRDLAIGAEAAVVFPEFTRAPEAHHPVALDQSFAVARWVAERGQDKGLDFTRFAVSGDSSGGNIAISLVLLAAQRSEIRFLKLVVFYPITDATCSSESYREYAEFYRPTAETMRWAWDQYAPEGVDRTLPTVSPMAASREDLAGLPSTLVITSEADVLRDDGEAFAARIREAGGDATSVRFGGTIHNFVMLHELHDTTASRNAVQLASGVLRDALAPVPC